MGTMPRTFAVSVALLFALAACGTTAPAATSASAGPTATPTRRALDRDALIPMVDAVGDNIAKSGLALVEPFGLTNLTVICDKRVEQQPQYGRTFNFGDLHASVFGFVPDDARVVVDQLRAMLSNCPDSMLNTEIRLRSATQLDVTAPAGVDDAVGACHDWVAVAGQYLGTAFAMCSMYLSRGQFLLQIWTQQETRQRAQAVLRDNLARASAALVAAVPLP